MNYKTIFLLVVFYLISMISIAGVGIKAEVINDIEPGKKLFMEARNLYQSQESLRPELKIKFEESRNNFLELEDGFERYYWLSRVEYFLVSYEEEDKRRKAYDRAAELGEKAVEYDKNHSDAYRILGDIYLDSVEYRGIFNQIAYGNKGKKVLKKAIELDKNNYAAYKSLGGYYIFAPGFLGGDVDKGIEMLKKSLNRSDDSVRYVAYCLLGNAYEDMEEIEQALHYVSRAVEIYPKREDTQKWLKRLKEAK